MGGALSLAFSSFMAASNTPLNAAVTFYGTPPVDDGLSALPKSTPVQAHYGALDDKTGFSDPATAEKLAKAWYYSKYLHQGIQQFK
jgi:carboxymethylenebutenolidase